MDRSQAAVWQVDISGRLMLYAWHAKSSFVKGHGYPSHGHVHKNDFGV